MKKTLTSTAVALACGLGMMASTSVNAATVAIDSLSISAGLFTFGPVSMIDTIGIPFSGDTGTDMAWGGANQGPGVFTTGFQFAGQPFEPQTDMSATTGTNGGAVGTIDDVTGDLVSVDNLDFGGRFGGTAASPIFYLAPDAGTLVIENGGLGVNTLTWSHTITAAEDPSFQFVGFTASWKITGQYNCGGTAGCGAVPVPAAVWLFGSGLLGLVGVARRRTAA